MLPQGSPFAPVEHGNVLLAGVGDGALAVLPVPGDGVVSPGEPVPCPASPPPSPPESPAEGAGDFPLPVMHSILAECTQALFGHWQIPFSTLIDTGRPWLVSALAGRGF